MNANVQAGLLMLAAAVALFEAWRRGALAGLTGSVVAAARGEQPQVAYLGGSGATVR